MGDRDKSDTTLSWRRVFARVICGLIATQVALGVQLPSQANASDSETNNRRPPGREERPKPPERERPAPPPRERPAPPPERERPAPPPRERPAPPPREAPPAPRPPERPTPRPPERPTPPPERERPTPRPPERPTPPPERERPTPRPPERPTPPPERERPTPRPPERPTPPPERERPTPRPPERPTPPPERERPTPRPPERPTPPPERERPAPRPPERERPAPRPPSDHEDRRRDEVRRDRERQRQVEQRERNRRLRERERQRQNEDRFVREREIERRRQIREENRRRFQDEDRFRRPPRHDVRDRDRWQRRYDRWWWEHMRPTPPPHGGRYPTPIPFPDHSDYWDHYQVAQLADAIEAVSSEIYVKALRELGWESEENQYLISLLYEVANRARVYSHAVEFSRNVYQDTLFELFNLEEAVNQAAPEMLCGALSAELREKFGLVKYYVEELLWQYRVDGHYDDNGPWGNPSGVRPASFSSGREGSEIILGPQNFFESETEVLACQNFSFRWSKPHEEHVWDLFQKGQETWADQLVIRGRSFGQVGRNGIAGISEILVNYLDGSQEDLVEIAKRFRHPNLTHNGQLKLADERDVIELPLDSRKWVESIQIRADSWIAPDQDVELGLSLVQDRRMNLNPRL